MKNRSSQVISHCSMTEYGLLSLGLQPWLPGLYTPPEGGCLNGGQVG